MDLAKDLEPPVPPEEVAAAEAAKPEVEAKAETPKEVVKEEKADEPKEEKLVRLEALHEERKRRQKLQAELQETQRRQALLEGRIHELYAAQQPKPQEPDPSDVVAVLQRGQELTQQQLAEIQYRQQQEDQVRQRATAEAQLVNWGVNQVEEFAQTATDYPDAYKFMRERRYNELKAMGGSPQQIAQTLKNDELWIMQNAYQTGQNPAEIIYRMAQNTGWKAKKEVPPEEKMKTLQKGVEASKTLGNSGQSADRPTPEQIATMSDDEFAELKAKLAKSGKRVSDIL